MNILVTNDDGLSAPGLKYLAEFAKTIGNVTVAAPKYEQSGRSHGVVIDRPFEVIRTGEFDYIGAETYRIDASPADCVRFAVDALNVKFDYVLAGVNGGLNLGDDISYSGTCACAFEGGLSGIPSVAFSAKHRAVESACSSLPHIWSFLSGNAFSVCNVFNVNIPADPVGIRFTSQGGFYYKDKFIPVEGENLYKAEYTRSRDPDAPLDINFDIDAVLAGYISVTPLLVKRFDADALRLLGLKNNS